MKEVSNITLLNPFLRSFKVILDQDLPTILIPGGCPETQQTFCDIGVISVHFHFK